MEQIFITLQGIIVRALPTFFIVILLHWYLKKVLFQPMDRVLEERRQKTLGAVKQSEDALTGVQAKLAEYEKALGDARAKIFHEQELNHKKLADQQAASLASAKESASARVAAAKAELAAEMNSAKASLQAESDRLADAIASAAVAGGIQ